MIKRPNYRVVLSLAPAKKVWNKKNPGELAGRPSHGLLPPGFGALNPSPEPDDSDWRTQVSMTATAVGRRLELGSETMTDARLSVPYNAPRQALIRNADQVSNGPPTWPFADGLPPIVGLVNRIVCWSANLRQSVFRSREGGVHDFTDDPLYHCIGNGLPGIESIGHEFTIRSASCVFNNDVGPFATGLAAHDAGGNRPYLSHQT